MKRFFSALAFALCITSLPSHADQHTSSNAVGPGFDCATTTNKIEKRICANPTLASLDLKLSQVYQEAQLDSAGVDGETGVRVDPLAREQKIWLKKRNQCNTDACLKNTYQKRIKYIETHWLNQ